MLLYSVVLQEEWCWLWNVNQMIIKIFTVIYIHTYILTMWKWHTVHSGKYTWLKF